GQQLLLTVRRDGAARLRRREDRDPGRGLRTRGPRLARLSASGGRRPRGLVLHAGRISPSALRVDVGGRRRVARDPEPAGGPRLAPGQGGAGRPALGELPLYGDGELRPG